MSVLELAALVGFLALLGVTQLVLRRRLGGRAGEAFLIACVLAIVIYVLGFFGFEALMSHYRTPSGVERQGPSRESYLFWGEVGLFAFYALVLSGAALLGYGVGRHLAGRGGIVALATGIVVAGLLGLTFPIVEFWNACTAGTPLILNRSINCG